MELLIFLFAAFLFLILFFTASKNKNTAFEDAFEKKLGRNPISYITEKLENQSDIHAIRYTFDILSAEIERKNHCKSPGFDYYYEKAKATLTTTSFSTPKLQLSVSKTFAVSQLIGKERFTQNYGYLLYALASNKEFMQFITKLRLELAGRELSDTKNANRIIADYFYTNNANERFPEVKQIVKAVITYGKQASAHISIYYAMFIYEH